MSNANCDFSAIKFDTCVPRDFDKATKKAIVGLAKRINPYSEALLEIILIGTVLYMIN